MREITLRQLLIHIVNKVDGNPSESRKKPHLNQIAPLATCASSTIVLFIEQSEVLDSPATSSMVAEATFLPEQGGEGTGMNMEAGIIQEMATNAHQHRHPANVALALTKGASGSIMRCDDMPTADAIDTKVASMSDSEDDDGQ